MRFPAFPVIGVMKGIVGLVALLALFAAAPAAAAEKKGLTFGDIAGAIVRIEAKIKPGARTAGSLGLERGGSGVVIGDDGLVLTIGYLIMESEKLTVTTHKGKTSAAAFVAYDHRTGFGLLRAAGPLNVKPLALGSSAKVKSGAPLLVLSTGNRGSVSPVRVVSRRPFAGYWEYLLDAAIYTMPPHREYGGAALVDLEGKLMGIGSLFINDALEPEQVSPGNMFVPIDLLKPILAQMIKSGGSGMPPRPWIGVYTGESEGRVFVNRVARDGPGAAAGLKPGDIIVGVKGRRVSDMADLFRKVWSQGDAGVEVPLDVLPFGAEDLQIKKVVIRSRNRHKWLKLGRE